MKDVADRPLTLAAHLDRAAELLDNGVYYNWYNPEHCNCGLVAKVITGLSATQLKQKVDSWPTSSYSSGTTNHEWKVLAAYNCPVTGRPMDEVFGKLYDAGFLFEDYAHLERTDNPFIVKQVGLTKTEGLLFWKETVAVNPNYKQAAHVALYCKAWAAMIRAYRAKHDPVVRQVGQAVVREDGAADSGTTTLTDQELQQVEKLLASLPRPK